MVWYDVLEPNEYESLNNLFQPLFFRLLVTVLRTNKVNLPL